MQFVIPEDFAHMIVDFHGENGLAWLDRLPTILANCEQLWNLTIKPPFANLSFHYVAPAIRADGTPVVLKAHALQESLQRRQKHSSYSAVMAWFSC